MQILIDGVEYVPIKDIGEDEASKALALRMNCDIGNNITIREYLEVLLLKLWEQEAYFSGKRPFGNSYWKYEIYKPLIEEGYIRGGFDDDGAIDWYDQDEAHRYVIMLIKAAISA